MKTLLTLACLAAAVATPAFAVGIVQTPDGGATALLAAVSFSGLVIAKNAMKKR